jgi:hypothetical protein
VARTPRACSAVERARCLVRVPLCLDRAAFDPAPAPVRGTADAEATPNAGWLVWPKATSGASVKATARPIEAILLTIIVDSGQY